jgi:hypothetical protein
MVDQLRLTDHVALCLPLRSACNISMPRKDRHAVLNRLS